MLAERVVEGARQGDELPSEGFDGALCMVLQVLLVRKNGDTLLETQSAQDTIDTDTPTSKRPRSDTGTIVLGGMPA